MTHQQESLFWYAYCACGVCGPVRAAQADAARDEGAHRAVCSTRKRAA